MQAFLLPSALRQSLDMTVGKIENGLERDFVKHSLNCLLITDPKSSPHSCFKTHYKIVQFFYDCFSVQEQ